MVMSAIRALMAGESPCFTAGEQIWDYLYSEDAARALIALAESGIDGRVYCLGSGEARPMRDYMLAIRDAVFPDGEIGLGLLPYPKGQTMYLCADIGELTSDTGFLPSVPFEEGIRRTARWLAREKNYHQ